MISEMKNAYVEASYRLIRAIESGQFSMTSPGACSSYGGCQYLDICQSPASLRKTIIESKYGITAD
jgi:hypothetical protein